MITDIKGNEMEDKDRGRRINQRRERKFDKSFS